LTAIPTTAAAKPPRIISRLQGAATTSLAQQGDPAFRNLTTTTAEFVCRYASASILSLAFGNHHVPSRPVTPRRKQLEIPI
jgi:hypothetical protein